MHSCAWVALLRHIPAEQHNKLALVTVGGTEMAVQSFLRIDHEFLVVKGRLAGSQDAGRVFFVPYAQIDYLGFQQEVKESEFQAMFDGLVVPPPPKGAPAQAAEDDPDLTAPGEAKPGSDLRPSIRSEILERYRNGRPTSSPNLPRPARNGED